MDRNKPITFKDLEFQPHKVGMFFDGHATFFIEKVGRVSVVGPYRNVFGLLLEDREGTYEVWAMDLWEEPIGYLSIEELDEILLDLQRSPLDVKKKLDKFKFTK